MGNVCFLHRAVRHLSPAPPAFYSIFHILGNSEQTACGILPIYSELPFFQKSIAQIVRNCNNIFQSIKFLGIRSAASAARMENALRFPPRSLGKRRRGRIFQLAAAVEGHEKMTKPEKSGFRRNRSNVVMETVFGLFPAVDKLVDNVEKFGFSTASPGNSPCPLPQKLRAEGQKFPEIRFP
ncbi:MAG: hypothetical protein LUH51_08015 [Firmicutes bacterium]|nr:hypothetical protein [Bacillota bacterium]